MEDSINRKFSAYLESNNLKVTKVIRNVYILINDKEEILMVNKQSHPGSMNYDFYKGWQIFSECSWGADRLNEDIISIEKSVVEQQTGYEFDQKDISIVNILESKENSFDVLQIVYFFKITNKNGFSFWSDWDIECCWLPLHEAIKQTKFEEDIIILEDILKQKKLNLAFNDNSIF